MIQSFQTRNKAMAWRPLAYIPDQDLHYHYWVVSQNIQRRRSTRVPSFHS
jgi:hypothetical protein